MKVEKIKRGYLFLTGPLDSENYQKMNKIPGYSKWDGRGVKFRPVSSSLEYIIKTWDDIEWSGCEDIVKNHESSVLEKIELAENKKKILEDDGSFEYKTIPFDHQRQIFLRSRDSELYGLLAEMGTGKSKIIIDTVAYQFSKGNIDTFVILAPNGVHRNWIINEIPIHMPDWVPYKMDFYAAKHGKKRMSSIMDILLDKTHLSIISINMEAFASSKAQSFLELMVQNKRCFVALDESTLIKNPNAKRSKFVNKACRDVVFKRIANGSPVTKGVEDLYSQIGFLSHDILGYDTFTTFKGQYCEEIKCKVDKFDDSPDARTFKKIVGYKNTDELVERMDPYISRVLKKDCIDLPEKVYTLHPFEMSSEQKRAYIELKNEFMTEVDGVSIEVELALVRLLRLQQITCGYYPNEEGELLPFPGKNPRLEALKEICRQVDENQEKCIIWCRFKSDIYAIEDMLGDLAVSYHGDVSGDDRIDAGKRFQNDDSVRYMIAMLSSNSGAVRGHTWTAANVTVYYSNSYDLDCRGQSEDRMHRIGLEGKALYIDIMALGTIDRQIINSLKDKKSIADLITRDGPTGFLDFINEGK